MRTCVKCLESKPLDQYGKHAAGRGGLQARCKACLKVDRAAKADEARARARARHKADPEKARERARAWRVANPEKAREKSRAWYEANRDQARANELAYVEANAAKVAARKKAWHEANRERILEAKRAYQAEHGAELYARHREKRRAYQKANPHIWWKDLYVRRAERFGFEPEVEDFTKVDVIARYGDSCVYCGGEFEQIDHYVPVSKGGPHTLDNVRPSCAACNNSKGSTELEGLDAADLDYQRRTA